VDIRTGTGYVTNPTADTITVLNPAKPAFTSRAKLAATIGHRVRFSIRTSGFPAPRLTAHGLLPRGLRLTIAAGHPATITGIPSRHDRSGRYVITLKAVSGLGRATQRLTIILK